jgi:hypothetical protein
MERFKVELDFFGTFSTEVFASSPKQAYEIAMQELKDEPIEVRNVPSFQIYDERMQPCGLNDQ